MVSGVRGVRTWYAARGVGQLLVRTSRYENKKGDQMATPGPEQRRLDAFIGRWITEGQTLGGSEAPTAEIVSSDVYEWMPGGFFVCHTVHGRIGIPSVLL